MSAKIQPTRLDWSTGRRELNMLMNSASSESQLREQSYRHLFKHLPICLVVADLKVNPAIIVDVNRRTELVYGYTAAELIGSPAIRLVAEGSWVNVQKIFQQVKQNETETTEVTSRHRDGTTFPTRVSATLDPADSGHMFIAVEDITAERQRCSEAEAIDAERLRIAHEIHDGVAQNLAGLRLKSALWSHLADQAPPTMRTALIELQTVLSSTIADIRRAIFALRPLDLETLGFLPALTQFVANFGDQNQLSARLDVCGHPSSLPVSYELPLFRIIQEGLNNVNRHARASSVLVHLEIDVTGSVVVSVRDNGRGFCPDLVGMPDRSRQFGLCQMRERIQGVGGSLDICSAIGQGTELYITLPPTKGVKHGINQDFDRR
jgi:PAS domain S-box-containing protein